jgi:RNA polymerase sigma factor for flagellar operon FliA
MRQTIERTRRDLTQKLGRAPDPEQVAEAAGLTTEELLEWENRFQVNQLQSLDEVYTDHSLIFESAEGAAEDKLEMTQLKGVLKLCIEKLPEREAMVLQFYYVEELNVYEIAAILNVTTGRVSQIKKAAVERLRTLITAQIGDV